MISASILPMILAFLLAPLLPGVINRTKAWFAGRKGPPLFQLYFDLYKLVQRGAVFSRTVTWVFRAGPVGGMACLLLALWAVPFAGIPAPFSFPGDLFLFIYLLGFARFLTLLSALDTGSSFEGMGASREALFGALAEPTLLMALFALARLTGGYSLSAILPGIDADVWRAMPAAPTLAALAIFIVLLAENARLPVDDPNTHLELTMIHEVMVLDHSGPDLALIEYGAALKLWIFAALVTGICLPLRTGFLWLDIGATLAGMLLLAVLVGVVESTMARLRMVRVPQLILVALLFAAFATILVVRA